MMIRINAVELARLKKCEDELADWHATFPGRDAQAVCNAWGETQRMLENLRSEIARHSSEHKEITFP